MCNGVCDDCVHSHVFAHFLVFSVQLQFCVRVRVFLLCLISVGPPCRVFIPFVCDVKVPTGSPREQSSSSSQKYHRGPFLPARARARARARPPDPPIDYFGHPLRADYSTAHHQHLLLTARRQRQRPSQPLGLGLQITLPLPLSVPLSLAMSVVSNV